MLFLVFACPAPANAGERDFGLAMFTTVLPAGWQAEQGGQNYVAFLPEGGSEPVTVLTKELTRVDSALRAGARAAERQGNELRTLPTGQGHVFLDKGRHVWLNAGEGWAVEITVPAPYKNVLVLLQGLKGKAEAPELKKLLENLAQSPDALDWLAHSGKAVPGTPLSMLAGAPMPDFTVFGATAGETGAPPTPANSFPDGWTASTMGLWTVIISDNGKHWAAARYYPPAPEDNAQDGKLYHSVLKVAELVGGKNIAFEEGQPYFLTPVGFASLECIEDKPCLFSLFSDVETVQEIYVSVP